MSSGLLALPASPSTVEAFMLNHVSTKAVSTLPQILAAVSHYHACMHLTSPAQTPGVLQALEGAKREYGHPTVPRAVITPEILQSAIILAMRPSSSSVIFCTVWHMLVEFYALMRFCAVAELHIKDVPFDSEGCHLYI